MRAHAVAALLLPSAVACVPIQLGEAQVASETVVATRTERPKHDGPMLAQVTQDDASVDVTANRACFSDVIELQTVERVTSRERRNASPNVDWSFLVTGLVSGGFGAAMIATPQTFVSSSTTPSSYDQTKNTVLGLGVALAALGAVLVTVPIVDAARASGTLDATTVIERREVRQRGIDCGTRPFVGASVSGTLGRQPIQLGLTGADGRLSLNLADYLPERTLLLSPPSDSALAISVNGQPVSSVRTDSIVRRYEDQAWRSANGDQCKGEPTAATCQTVADFLRRYPHGRHSDEANADIRQYSLAMENAAWENLGRAQSCFARPTQASCGAVSQFLSDFPNGAHGPEARRALDRLREATEREESERQAAAERARQTAARQAQAEEHKRALQQEAVQRHSECAATCSAACTGDVRCRNDCIATKCN
jgi:hypothetical protein